VAAECVLDASAVLAVLFQEKGSGRVEPLLAQAVMSTVNMAEVLVRLIRGGSTPEEATEAFEALGIGQIEPFSETAAILSASFQNTTSLLGLSLGDRACLGTAFLLRLPAVTADRAWANLGLPVKIRAIR
jgi:ribonuclease VapC